MRTGLGILCMLALVGCGSGEQTVYPVSGTLTLDGKPFGPAILVFESTTPAEKGVQLKTPGGQADASGNITLTTYKPGDGAPAGDYRVYLPPNPMNPGQALPQIYQDPKTSGLTVKIEPKSDSDANELKIELKLSAGPLARPIGTPGAMGINPALMPKTDS